MMCCSKEITPISQSITITEARRQLLDTKHPRQIIHLLIHRRDIKKRVVIRFHEIEAWLVVAPFRRVQRHVHRHVQRNCSFLFLIVSEICDAGFFGFFAIACELMDKPLEVGDVCDADLRLEDFGQALELLLLLLIVEVWLTYFLHHVVVGVYGFGFAGFWLAWNEEARGHIYMYSAAKWIVCL